MPALLLTLLLAAGFAPVRASLPPEGASGSAGGAVVINEIQYNSASFFDTEDWVELHNPTGREIDLGGWVFADEKAAFTIPEGTTLAPDGFVVICASMALFSAAYPRAVPCIGDFNFGLSGGGETIRLFSAGGRIVDAVDYDDDKPWPNEADGRGATLELLDPSLDNAFVENWRASGPLGGTPGATNSVATGGEGPPSESGFRLEPAFPNPSAGAVTVRYALAESGAVSLRVYDARGREVARLAEGERSAGDHAVAFALSDSGTYLVRLQTPQGVRTRRLTLAR